MRTFIVFFLMVMSISLTQSYGWYEVPLRDMVYLYVLGVTLAVIQDVTEIVGRFRNR